ncbi:MAG TPA: putative inorganic carbon transporter subunit DabA, partial [Methylomirabilota bacterium]|nr:putative inorganic carbon transporter subunit DabA [Methylomirabilota bacterium]
MAQVAASGYSEAQRMELRALVRLASEVVGYYWPMRTFVHHNPLHGLEDLPFEKAVSQGRQLLGGKGYLSNEMYREYYRSGRISARHIDAELGRRAQGEVIQIGDREIRRLDVLRAHLLQGLCAPPPEVLELQIERHPDREAIAALADRFSAVSRAENDNDSEDHLDPWRSALLATWCDRLFGAQIADQINREMIKWCTAFLDEGHATWPMPFRDKGFYRAWRLLVEREWCSCGIKNHRERLARLPAVAEDAVMSSLAALGVPSDAWQDYLSLHFTALPGWAGFIKWRADQSEYEWQLAYPIDLVQYAAVRLWYERELGRSACRRALGIDANFEALLAEMRKRGNRSS